MFEATLHGVSRGDYSPFFRRFWVFRLHVNPEEGKQGNFRYDLNYNPNNNNIENNINITIRPLPEIWKELLGTQYGLG